MSTAVLLMLLASVLPAIARWPPHGEKCAPCVCKRMNVEGVRRSWLRSALCSNLNLTQILKLPSDADYLNLDGNYIESIDFDAISSFQALNALSMRDNPLQTLEMNVFQNLSRLQFLDLTGCNLTDVPTAVFNNTKLDTLRGLKIDKLPYNLFEGLSQLRHLQLTTDDDEIQPGLLDELNLRQVELSLTLARHLPPAFFPWDSAQATHLQKVTIRGRHLETLEEDLFQSLINIQDIRLYLNMPNLPSGLFKANDSSSSDTRRLKMLLIDGVDSLPGDIFHDLTFLTHLTIHGLKTALSGDFTKGLSRLIFLDLSNNDIKQLEQSWFERLPLKELNLSGNSLTHIREELTPLNQVNMLNVSFNKLRTLHPRAFHTFRIELTELDLSHNEIHDLPGTLFREMINLKTLHLDHNAINEMDPFQFKDTTYLHNLFLQFNNIDSLKYDNFTDLQDLVQLNISHNNISRLGDYTFLELAQLRVLDLSYNYIETIPNDLMSIDLLDQVNFLGNPLMCDCGVALLLQIVHWGYSHVKVEAECAGPPEHAGKSILDLERSACPGLVILTTWGMQSTTFSYLPTGVSAKSSVQSVPDSQTYPESSKLEQISTQTSTEPSMHSVTDNQMTLESSTLEHTAQITTESNELFHTGNLTSTELGSMEHNTTQTETSSQIDNIGEFPPETSTQVITESQVISDSTKSSLPNYTIAQSTSAPSTNAISVEQSSSEPSKHSETTKLFPEWSRISSDTSPSSTEGTFAEIIQLSSSDSDKAPSTVHWVGTEATDSQQTSSSSATEIVPRESREVMRGNLLIHILIIVIGSLIILSVIVFIVLWLVKHVCSTGRTYVTKSGRSYRIV